MKTRIAILIATAFMCVAPPAWADGRTVAYLAGFAYGVVVQCPGKEMDDTKALPPRSSIRPGGTLEFAEGAAQVVEMFRTPGAFGRGAEVATTCENVCDFRPGQCYFLKNEGD